jgi:hypothetical protein
MALDKKTYADPFTFDPTRYLPKPLGREEPYPMGTFGFGRRHVFVSTTSSATHYFDSWRVCPGRHLAEDSVWIAATTILSTLSISKAIGDDGKEIEPTVAFELGVTRSFLVLCLAHILLTSRKVARIPIDVTWNLEMRGQNSYSVKSSWEPRAIKGRMHS